MNRTRDISFSSGDQVTIEAAQEKESIVLTLGNSQSKIRVSFDIPKNDIPGLFKVILDEEEFDASRFFSLIVNSEFVRKIIDRSRDFKFSSGDVATIEANQDKGSVVLTVKDIASKLVASVEMSSGDTPKFFAVLLEEARKIS